MLIIHDVIWTLLQTGILTGAAASAPTEVVPANLFWGDADGDGLPDAVAIDAAGSARLFHNEGDGTLTDATAWAGLEGIGAARLALWEDYDLDGQLDLFVGTGSGASRLFHNLGDGRFEDVASRAGIGHEGSDLAASWIDFDQDGQPDLHVRTAEGDALYRNLGTGTFEGVELDMPVVAPGVGPAIGTGADAAGVDGASGTGGSSSADRGVGSALSGSGPLPGGGSDDGSGGSRSSVVVGSGMSAPAGTQALFPGCVGAIEDQAGGDCITASTVAELGSLFPLGSATYVASSGPIGGTSASWTQMRDASDGQFVINKNTPPGEISIIDINPRPQDTTSDAAVRLLRSTNTTGVKRLIVQRGDGTTAASAQIGADGTHSYFQMHGGFVGLGTTNPGALLDAYGGGVRATRNSTQYTEMINNDANGGFLRTISHEGNKKPMYIEALHDETGSPLGSDFIIFRTGPASAPNERMRIRNDGRVGIGTTNPAKTLDVNGDIRSKTIELTGADLVEAFDTEDASCTPGTVVVIDSDRAGFIKSSDSAYDKRVAGIVSGAGGVDHGIYMGQGSSIDGSTPIAMTGRVYVKASAENGPIRPGDRLTTAALAGHAMRVTDEVRSVGAVIGKAMTSLDSDTGLVLVLVNLQ